MKTYCTIFFYTPALLTLFKYCVIITELRWTPTSFSAALCLAPLFPRCISLFSRSHLWPPLGAVFSCLFTLIDRSSPSYNVTWTHPQALDTVSAKNRQPTTCHTWTNQWLNWFCRRVRSTSEPQGVFDPSCHTLANSYTLSTLLLEKPKPCNPFTSRGAH